MKNLITILLLFCAFALNAQSAFTMISSKKKSDTHAERVSSINNPWLGAKVAMNISGELEESFLISARVMKVVASGAGWALPVMADVGLDNLDSLNDNGVSIGLYPYYSLINIEQFQLLSHAGFNYHILDRNDLDYKNQFRFYAGVELALYDKERNSPITLSIAPEHIISTGEIIDRRWQLDITTVIPIANGLGFLAEGAIPLTNPELKTAFRIGVIVNNDLK